MTDTTTVSNQPTAQGGAAKAPDKNTGIVAFDSAEHAEAKGVFQTIKDKLDALGADVKEDLKKLETLLHL